MTLKEWIKQRILKFQGLERLSESPNDERLTFISNSDEVKLDEIKANRTWFYGNGDELLNFYTQQQAVGFADNPIYNRNKRNYFWSLSAQECDIKRVHSGLPKAIIETLTNVVGVPQIDEPSKMWDKIAEENDYYTKLSQQIRPLVMVEGYGGIKYNINPKLSKHPIIEFYDAEYIEYIVKSGILVGMIFKSFYKDENGKDYVLLESRYRANGNSYIEYNLFKLLKNNELQQADLDCIPELSSIPREPEVVEGLDEILATPVRYFYDPLNPKYGKSIYAGKLDLFDMLDEVWSQASQTNRVSTPVEYYDPDVINRGPNGYNGMPNLYNRQFVQKAGIPDGEGNMNQDIVTTQPDLNFEKYMILKQDIENSIMIGTLSPASMGIDVSRKDNADAQREKEKVTIMTRNNIIASEIRMNRDVVRKCLILQEYIDSSKITIKDYDIQVKYNDFANPTFETQLPILGNAWANGEISTEKYVDLLWVDKLTDKEKLKEIEWLEEHRKQDEVDMNELFGGPLNDSSINNAIPEPGEDENTMEEAQE